MVDVVGGSEASVENTRIVAVADLLTEAGISGTATSNESAVALSAIRKAEGDVRKFLQYDPVLTARTEFYPLAQAAYGNRDGVWEADSSNAFFRRVSDASTDELQLKHIPVRSSTTIQIWVDHFARHGTRSASFDSDTKQVEGTDFWLSYDGEDDDGNKISRDGIVKSHGRWPQETGSVKVTYTAGYSATEFNGTGTLVDASPLRDAILEEALRRFKRILTVWTKKAKQGHIPAYLQSEKLGDYNYSLAAGLADQLMSSTTLLPETRERLAPFRHYGSMFL